jgi:UDP-GlcNAc3NAcA epimerase
MNILTVIGARPQFVKAAVVSKALAQAGGITETIVHTGQHFDENMSAVFFDEMNIPRPAYNLNCSDNSHGAMIAHMIIEIEKIILARKPDFVLVYGDTNSTLAGAVTAAKLQIPIIHIEAGLRSFNLTMPEEINRILTDRVSEYLFCPTPQAVENLAREAITRNVFHVGDVMYDAVLAYSAIAEKKTAILETVQLHAQNYYLATVHRAENTDAQKYLEQILSAFSRIATPNCPLILPLHPRTKKCIDQFKLHTHISDCVKIIPPVGYFDMLVLEKNAKTILTDSGGMQKEAYFHRVPCITLRNETEWTETVTSGWNQLTGAHCERIVQAVLKHSLPTQEIDCYGAGNAAQKIVEILTGLNN